MPSNREDFKFSDMDSAMQKRLTGEKLKPIEGVSDDLNQIVLKACAFNQKDRFSSASDMKEALMGNREKRKGQKNIEQLFKDRKKAIAIICAAFAVLAVFGTILSGGSNKNTDVQTSSTTIEETATEAEMSSLVIASDMDAFPKYTGSVVTVSSAEEFERAVSNETTRENTIVEVQSGDYHFSDPVIVSAENIKIKGKGNTKPVLDSQLIIMSRGVMIEDVDIRITKGEQTDEGNEGIRFQETGYLRNVNIKMEYTSESIIMGVTAYAPLKMEGCNLDVDYGQNGNVALRIGDDFSINNCVFKSNETGIEFLGAMGGAVTEDEINNILNNNTFLAEDNITVYSSY